MKGNWIYFLLVIFFILRALSKAAKKQQPSASEKEKLGKAAADQVRRKRLAEVTNNLRQYSEASRPAEIVNRTTTDDTDFESPYSQPVSAQTLAQADASSGINAGVTSPGYKETKEERAAYDTQTKPTLRLLPNLTTASYRQFIIAKEVFDKPKALQK